MSVQPGQQVLPALLVLPGRKESKALPVPKVTRVIPAQQALLALLVRPGQQGRKAYKDRLALPVPQVRKDQPHRWSIRR